MAVLLAQVEDTQIDEKEAPEVTRLVDGLIECITLDGEPLFLFQVQCCGIVVWVISVVIEYCTLYRILPSKRGRLKLSSKYSIKSVDSS